MGAQRADLSLLGHTACLPGLNTCCKKKKKKKRRYIEKKTQIRQRDPQPGAGGKKAKKAAEERDPECDLHEGIKGPGVCLLLAHSFCRTPCHHTGANSMVENTSLASKSALSAFPSAPSLLLSTSPHHSSPFSVSRPSQGSQTVPTGGGGGMRLEAVMENLQRQQAARLALEEKLRQEKDRELRCMVESRIQQQALAIRHYQAAVRAAAAAVVTSPTNSNTSNTTTITSSPAVTQLRPPLIFPRAAPGRPEDEEPKSRSEGEEGDYDDEEMDDEDGEEEEEDNHDVSSHLQKPGSPNNGVTRTGHSEMQIGGTTGTAQDMSPNGQTGHHEWTYEEQFKQLYELDDDPKRKEFLDDLFSFMQKRGTPVNRIPIMAKQVLDLYTLYRLVTEKGGLVEVINKKIWREITKGLSLPTSITSAAFTLRTQYMKYLYPYECEKRGLSSPGELQAAIDSNRREGRRQSFGSGLFSYSPVGTPNSLTSPKINMSSFSNSTHNGGQISQILPIKKEDGLHAASNMHKMGIPLGLPGSHAVTAHAVHAMQAAALEQLREKLESGEPPEKKMAMMAEEQQRLMQHALQHNLLAMAAQFPMNIKINNRDDRQETAMNLSASGISSINMSIELNGVVYAGVLFARRPGTSAGSSSGTNQSQPSPAPAQNPPLSSQGHTPPGSSP
uniref:AT-rich interactive domain-containing protein 3 n=1 Tax=Leptobrachium leishanense TaxID=445787 RepID=A0A8C5LHN7_9ANUR